MERFIINGGKRLYGSLEIPCAKNAFLPILAATILCKDTTILHNCPHYSDIENMCNVLEKLGAIITRDKNDLIINAKKIRCKTIPKSLTGSIRSSIFCLGSIIGRCKHAILSYPGGCAIGKRPIDIHLAGLEKLGVTINEKDNIVECKTEKLVGADINLRFASVGATENLILASVLAEGTTSLHNCAKEPEVSDLINFLNLMGADISGKGTSDITINGVKKLKGIEYKPIPDRIYAGTMLIACATCKGKLTLKNFVYEHNECLIKLLLKTGCKISIKDDIISMECKKRLKCINNISTLPFPGFPTDLQQTMSVLQSVSKGTSLITENLFESRYNHIHSLVNMGAKICIIGKKLAITGVNNLIGNEVVASDLRGGASLIIAGLVAKGVTTVYNADFVDRGYESIEKDLQMLGADIKREK